MREIVQLPLPGGSPPPEWIHLLPAGPFPAVGGRKTLRADNLSAVVAASMKGGKIVLDENHSTDLAAPRGKSSPAMGWIEQMEVRADGIWGRVRWTRRGRTAMEDHAYRAISPVLESTPAGVVTQILRAALTNTPDLKLTTLHSRTTEQEGSAMTYPLAGLRARLGLGADAGEAEIDHALDTARGAVSLHSRAAALAGLGGNASDEEIVSALKKQQEQVTLHSVGASRLQNQINELKAANAKMAAENWISEAGRRKIINEELKSELVTLHSSNAPLAEKLLAGLPDAPSSTVTLHSRAQHNGAMQTADPSMKAADVALGLTDEDLKTGGIG